MTDNEKAVIEAAKDTLKDLLMGFVACRRCGSQEDLATLDCVKPLVDAINALTAGTEPMRDYTAKEEAALEAGIKKHYAAVTEPEKPCHIQTPHKCHIEEP